jgi:outer membrane protein assembly factor BamB
LIYPTSEGELLAVDKKTGNILWTFKVSDGIATEVQVLDEFIVVGETKGRVLILSPSDGKIVTEYDTGWGVSASPTVDALTKQIYVASNAGNFFALEFKRERTGTKLPWEKRQ